MKKSIGTILFLSLVFTSGTFAAQNYAWTRSVVNTGLEFSMQAICAGEQELCVAGHSAELNYRLGDPGLFDGSGTSLMSEYEISRAGDLLFVYGFDGELRWHYYFDTDEAELEGITYDVNNQLVALVYQHGLDAGDDEEDDGENADENDIYHPAKRRPEDLAGYCLYYFNTTGSIVKNRVLTGLHGIDVTDFKSHPSGGFVIAGHAQNDTVSVHPLLVPGKGGGDLVVFVSAKDSVAWGDMISYDKETCCTFGADPKIAVDEKGNVFLGGSYMHGARFGGKFMRLAPIPYNPGAYYEAEETYVAAYSPEGKFLWVNTAGTQSWFTGIAAAGGYVYIGTSASRTETLYDHSVDTADHEHVFITVFDAKGKFRRNLSTGAGSKILLSTDAKGNLVATGTIGIETGYLKRPASDDKTKRRLEDCFVAFYSPGGTFQKCLLTDLVKIPSSDPPVCLAAGPGEIFMIANITGGMSLTLHMLDNAFPNLEFAMGASFVARWK
ncbi:MAG TPA: hypothetical protein VFU15_11200 [Bacteroidia bacterium]|nr:hypothetical protein [Bacteroidia bacterium]